MRRSLGRCQSTSVILFDFPGLNEEIHFRPKLRRSDTVLNRGCPRGFVYQLQLLSTWGDIYYVGLNGIELYDEYGQPLKLSLKSRDFR